MDELVRLITEFKNASSSSPSSATCHQFTTAHMHLNGTTSKQYLLLRFQDPNYACISRIPQTCYLTCKSHHVSFNKKLCSSSFHNFPRPPVILSVADPVSSVTSPQVTSASDLHLRVRPELSSGSVYAMGRQGELSV